MDSSFLDRYAVVDIYNRYCEIKSRAYACIDQGCAAEDEPTKANYLREALAQLLTLVESRVHARSLFDELSKLKSKVELTVDFSEFSRFYDFVFFVCRENGQRNITVSRAVMAWRLVLAGRFRLLDPWCDFVEKNQRHNISEDTWRQVLAFSRCVHENLEGYDSAGAWPILIDDFVEYMYSIRGSTAPLSCNCVDSEGQQSLDDPLRGLKIAAGLKRKSWEDFKVQEPGGGLDSFDRSSYSTPKRKQCCYLNDNSVKWGENLMGNGENPMGNGANECMKIIKHCSSNSNSVVGCGKLVCAVEGCLSKGFAGLFSGRSCLQFGDHRGGLGQQPAHLKGSVPYM